ncbi:MAG: TIGR02302 family protein [Hyphomicrobium sp.]
MRPSKSHDTASRLTLTRSFERKVRRARLAMVFEQLWLRLWIIVVVAGVFVLASLLGLWPMLGDTMHTVFAGLFGLALLAAIIYAGRIHWPTREEAISRIERVSGVPHRPASSYEDTLSSVASDPATMQLWKAHRLRMAQALAGLRPGPPRPRTDRYDPYALRALLLLFIVTLGGLIGTGSLDRLKSAFKFGTAAGIDARLDAWVSPPPYTGKPPLMLADGAAALGGASAAEVKLGEGTPEVPERSMLIVRGSGTGIDRLAIEIGGDGAEPQTLMADEKKAAGGISEIRYELRRPVVLRVLNGRREMARWRVDVIPDHAPRIVLTKKPEVTPRGSMKLTYKVEDDYGVASAEARLEKSKKKAVDPAKAWAQAEPLKGPRWPAVKPPPITLRLPTASSKDGEQHTYVETASHPWAGLKVTMRLVAKDVAGQTGTSEPIEIVLPEKRFTKPLALAVVEQRRKLLDDHRYRRQVRTALDALTYRPEGFIEDTRVYLGLRTVYHRLEADRTRAGMASSIKQLWHIALRIEDGDLSEAERRLKEAQDKLAKALESGASEEEIRKLMQELKQALNDYMQQLAKEAGDQDMQEGRDPNKEALSQQDLEEMMKNLEDMARNGSREEAQQLLSEMQDLMERLQAGKMTEKERQQSRDMQKAMEDIGDMAGDQQKLMDETFEEMRKEDGGSKGEGQQKPNMRGMPGGEKGRKGENSAPSGQRKAGRGGQPGQRGQQGQQQGGVDPNGEDGDGAGQEGNEGQLGQRQRELKDRLAKLQRDLREKGLGSPEQLDAAESAMQSAEQALREGDFAEATEQQGEALEQLRESGKQMGEQMAAQMPGRNGRDGKTPRDPLGRPQRSQGPDLGTSVKVPDQIDQQRAREILEELRRRSSEASRPPVELDYLERLLKRF